MFHSVACPDWKPGQPLTPAGALLFRTRAEAEAFAPEATIVAVAVRFDPTTRTVHLAEQGFMRGGWSAAAVSNQLGGITVFGSIPAQAVRCQAATGRGEEGRAEGLLGEFHGWDSLTMALLA